MKNIRLADKSLFLLIVLVIPMALLCASAIAQTPTLVYSFEAKNSGIFSPFPPSVMAQGRDGNIYGTTDMGGTNQSGGIFSITPSGGESTLYDFIPANGQHCNLGLTLGNDGNFYGACVDGGPNNAGELYRVTPSGVFTTLYNFTETNGDGGLPNAPPIQASDGNFYGTTELGGTHNDGTLYRLTRSGKVTIIHSFLYPQDGGAPGTGLVQGNDGNLYGTTLEGGGVFKFTPTGKLIVIHTFSTSDGEVPLGTLIQGSDGSFYGTTSLGGLGEGTIFKVTPSGSFTVLHNFDSTVDGQGDPWAGLVEAGNDNYYGASFRSGLSGENPYGGLFEITNKGSYSSLYLFDGTVGANPGSALIQHTNGLLYGNTQNNAGFNVGSVYSFDVGASPLCLPNLKFGKVGTIVGILGQGFTSSSVVKFGGIAATSISIDGAGYLTAVVPNGAVTGKITVTTAGTTLVSLLPFKVLP